MRTLLHIKLKAPNLNFNYLDTSSIITEIIMKNISKIIFGLVVFGCLGLSTLMAQNCPATIVSSPTSEEACGTACPTLPINFLVLDGLGAPVGLSGYVVTWNPNPGGLSGCVVPTGCTPAQQVYTPTLTCTSDPTSTLIGPSHTLTVYPTLMESVVMPSCSGGIPSVNILSPDGSVCASVTGTAGSSGCPGISSTLVYNESFFAGSSCPQVFANSITESCDLCCPSLTNVTVSATEVCGGGNVVFSAILDPATPNNADLYINGPNGTYPMSPTGGGLYTASITLSSVSCAPQSLDFDVILVCTDIGAITGFYEQTITVYPSSVEQFISVSESSSGNSCTYTATVNDPDCAGVLSINSPVSQVVSSGAGTLSFGYTYSGPQGAGCISSIGSISVPYSCQDCGNNPGVMPTGIAVACAGQTISTSAVNTILAPGDIQAYVLHDGTGSIIYDANSTGIFVNDGTIPVNVLNMYVSSVVGPDNDGDGIPDLTDPCTSAILPGQPVRLLEEIVITSTTYCNPVDYSYTVNFTITGGYPSFPNNNSANYNVTGNWSGIAEAGMTYTFGPLADDDSYTITVLDDQKGCSESFVSAPISCFDPIFCPSDITALGPEAVCSGQPFSLSENVSGTGNYNITWFEYGVAINPNNITVSNNDCAPESHIYNFQAVCADDPSQVYMDQVVVTVYPAAVTDNFFTITNTSDCGIQAVAVAGCEDYIEIIEYVSPDGMAGTGTLTVNYQDNPGCVQNFSDTYAYTCSCDISMLSFCTTPITTIEICLPCPVAIDTVTSLYWCSLDEMSDDDNCFEYTPLPNMEIIGGETLYVTYFDPMSGQFSTVEIYVETALDCGDDPPILCDDIIYTCTEPVTGIDLCLDCQLDANPNVYIDNIESLYDCTINDLAGACFEYIPLPGLEDVVDADTVVVTYCTSSGICEDVTYIIELSDDCSYVEPPEPLCDDVFYGCSEPLMPFDFCLSCQDEVNDNFELDSISSIFSCTITDIEGMCFTYVPLPSMELVGSDTVTMAYCDVVTNVCDTAYLIMTFENCDDGGGIVVDVEYSESDDSSNDATDVSISENSVSTQGGLDNINVQETTEINEDPIDSEKIDNGVLEFVSFNMYPVPVNDVLTIDYILEREQNIILEVLNLEGKVLYSEKFADILATEHIIDVSTLSAGAYMVRMRSEQRTAYHKFIKD